jgi:hypothetical protein
LAVGEIGSTRAWSTKGSRDEIQEEADMKAESNAGFAKRMMLLGRSAHQFKPTATYDPDGDCIEFLAKPDPFYAERIDDLVTVYYSQETNEVIGSLIKGVSHFRENVLKKMPGFKIVVQEGRIRLEHLFLARLWFEDLDPTGLTTLTYRKLMEVAEETDAEAELCPA